MHTVIHGVRGQWQVREAVAPSAALLAELVPIIRSSFAAGDLLPGLPAADGTGDTIESVLSDLRDGVRMWVAYSDDGHPVGCVRAIPRADAIWQIRRLAVTMRAQGMGIGRLLVRELETAARAEGMRKLVVWALVERGIPPFYAKLGYRTTGHFGSPDKLLSEAIMELNLDGPRPVLFYPWGTEPHAPAPGLLITWFVTQDRTVAVVGNLTRDGRSAVGEHHALAGRLAEGAQFVGGDGWTRCPEAEMTALAVRLRHRADAADGTAMLFRRTCTAVVEFTMPRAVEPRLLALWRLPLPTQLAYPAAGASGE